MKSTSTCGCCTCAAAGRQVTARHDTLCGQSPLSAVMTYVLTASAGCEEALMPHGGLDIDMTDRCKRERYNEEVRLLYVGMTRAKQQLHLLHAQQRDVQGRMRRVQAFISPFLHFLPGCRPWSRFIPSKQNMQEPAFGAAYSLRQTHTTAAPSPEQPRQTRQIMSATSEEDPPVVAPATPAQRRAARRRQ